MNDPNPIPTANVPTITFTTSPPASQQIGAVTFALSADINHTPKYTLTVKRNGTAVAAPATVQSGNAAIDTTAIDIPTTGTGGLVIASAYFTNLGAGNYTITLTANDNPGLPGTGTASASFTLTAP